MGREVVVAITDGRLDGSALLTKIFGPWEQILGQPESLAQEFDGRRRKWVLVKIIGYCSGSRRIVTLALPQGHWDGVAVPGDRRLVGRRSP